jgi:hypothetical protein
MPNLYLVRRMMAEAASGKRMDPDTAGWALKLDRVTACCSALSASALSN